MTTNLLTTIDLTSAGTGTGSWADVPGMTTSPDIAGTGSVVILVAQLQIITAALDLTADFRFTVDGSPVGPVMPAFADGVNQANGATLVHAVTGLSAAAHTFAVQMINLQGTAAIDTTRTRSFQVYEFTENAEIILDLAVSSATGNAPATWTNMTDMSGAPTVTDGSMLMLITNLPSVSGNGGANFSFAIDGSRVGPEQLMNAKTATELNGLAMMYAETGVTAGARTISLQWEDTFATTRAIRTTVDRTLQVVEFTGADWILLADIVISTADADPATWGLQDGMTTTQTPDSANSALLAMANTRIHGEDAGGASDFQLAMGGARVGAVQTSQEAGDDKVKGLLLARMETGHTGSTVVETHWQALTGASITNTFRPRSMQLLEFIEIIVSSGGGAYGLGSGLTIAYRQAAFEGAYGTSSIAPAYG